MTRRRLLLLLGMTSCLCAITAVPASAFTEFKSEKAPLLTRDHNLSDHEFIIPGVAPIECASVKSNGKVATTKSSQVTEKLEYTKCFAFITAPAIVSPVEFEFNINGNVASRITSTIKVPSALCEYEIPSKSNQSLIKASFANVGSGKTKEIEVASEIGGITESVKGSSCGSSGKIAEYKGKSLVEGIDTTEKVRIGIEAV